MVEQPVEVEAVLDKGSDWLLCGNCGRRIGIGIAAVRDGARVPCKGCSVFVLIPVPKVRGWG